MMEKKPLLVVCSYKAPIETVWKAISDKDQMKEWYFELEAFKAEKGFQFQFTGGDEKEQYLHHCEVLLSEPPNTLRYTWTYPEHNDGYSIVSWELLKDQDDERITQLTLQHEGLESFPTDDPNFAVASFTKGWNFILGESLRDYLGKINQKEK